MIDPIVLQAIASRIEAGELLSQEEQRFLLTAYQSGQLHLGERAIAVRGDADSAVLITGDSNSVQINDIEAIRIALRTILQEQLSTPQPTPTAGRRRTFLETSLAVSLNLPSASFAFEVVTINDQGQESQRKQAYAQQSIEDLGKGTHLEMVLIPGGSFLMGSPDAESDHAPSESPQHQVTVPEFWMSKYPITQAQWQAVAKLPAVNRSLKSKPSKFKGGNLPVECISWYDCVEFCDRLVQHTGRPYRLPSEAEWEYACRAGTNTSFHFGKTLSLAIANYSSDTTNNPKQKQLSQGCTTSVGSHHTANAFGLFDMHGNVWEWCLDCWHDSYTNAPINGSAWMNSSDNHPHVTRGGSWFDPVVNCQSTSRVGDAPEIGGSTIGFRVACSFS